MFNEIIIIKIKTLINNYQKKYIIKWLNKKYNYINKVNKII